VHGAPLDYRLSVLSPDGSGEASITLQCLSTGAMLAEDRLPSVDLTSLESRYLAPLRSHIEQPISIELIENLGEALADLLLPEHVRTALFAEWLRGTGSAQPIRLRLAVADPEMSSLPWEFIYVNESPPTLDVEGFLCLHPRLHLSREISPLQPGEPISAHPLRILVAWADPGSACYGTLPSLTAEAQSVLAALSGSECRWIEARELRHATPAGLERDLSEFKPHVLHFIGHGDVRASGGVLILEGERAGVEASVYADILAQWLSRSAVRLVVLSACRTATRTGGVAQTLALQGIPAVVAMQLPLRDSVAAPFARVFYGALMESGSVEQALHQARQVLRSAQPDWGVPVLYLSVEDSRLFLRSGTSTTPAGRDPGSLPPGVLPAALDRFIGRKRERTEIRRALTRGVPPCLTIVGAAGSGKTRLALQVAQEAQKDFPDGVYFVSLEETGEPGSVLTRIAAALSLAISPNANPLPLLQNALSAHRVLLVLDNFEQVLPAADVLASLVKAVPTLRLLVTSREPLKMYGERVYDLDPLPVPAQEADYAEIRSNDSVRLFAERAQAATRQFKLTEANAAEVAALCSDLSGLPLAIELVASEARYRPLSRLLAEIRAELMDIEGALSDAPARQRSLRAAFDWSYRQLDEADRLLFAELGLFETAFSEEMARDVCTVTGVREGLRRLRDKSLICYEGGNRERPSRLLIPAREYARMHLGRPEGPLRQRFIAAFTRRAQALRDRYYNREEPEALCGIQADLDNFRTAWGYACEDNDVETIAELGLAVTFFAPLVPRSANLEAWVGETERALSCLNDRRGLGRLYNTRARLANLRGNFVEAVTYQQAALANMVEIATPAEIADLHSTLAFFALRAHDPETAERHARLGIELGRHAGEIEPEAVALFVLASVLTPRDLEQATQMAERSVHLFRQQGQYRGMAHAHIALAAIADACGKIPEAEAHYLEALRLCKEQHADVIAARCLEALGKFYGRRGKVAIADYLLLAATQIQKILGMPETARHALPTRPAEMIGDIPPLGQVLEYMLSAPPQFRA